MHKSKFRKGLVVAIIVLFVGATVVPTMIDEFHITKIKLKQGVLESLLV